MSQHFFLFHRTSNFFSAQTVVVWFMLNLKKHFGWKSTVFCAKNAHIVSWKKQPSNLMSSPNPPSPTLMRSKSANWSRFFKRKKKEKPTTAGGKRCVVMGGEWKNTLGEQRLMDLRASRIHYWVLPHAVRERKSCLNFLPSPVAGGVENSFNSHGTLGGAVSPERRRRRRRAESDFPNKVEYTQFSNTF